MKVPASSLVNFEKDGYMTKQGGGHKTWKKRYFILKGRELYYYKTPKDSVFTGKIDIEPTSVIKEEPSVKKNPFVISVSTSHRVFLMHPDRQEDVKPWIDALKKAASGDKSTTPSSEVRQTQPASHVQATQQTSTFGTASPAKQSGPVADTPRSVATPAGPVGDMSPRDRLTLAKGVVNFLKDPESKVLEFWQIWAESIPQRDDLTSGSSIEFQVATTADMQKLTWRTSGPQNIFIQKMVDFFWNVGAPESEIDRLNDVGALINPIRIGSWIDMSAKGGMDGGWFFPEEMPFRRAIESADRGDAVERFTSWAEAHDVANIYAVGRDMGAAPPRQTELKFKVPGADFGEQLSIALNAFASFGFPPIPDNALKILRDSHPDGQLAMSVITSAEGFVRLGLLVPSPRTETVLALCTMCQGNQDEMASFEASLGKDAPSYVEYQYLMKNFGYGVYKEGFDVVFHYIVGEEVA